MAERRSLLDDDDATSTHGHDDIFDDQYEVDDFDFDGVADGFRPNVEREERVRHDARQEDGNMSEDTIEPVQRITPVHHTSALISPSRSRNSMRKLPAHANPFASPDDEAGAEAEPRMEFEPGDDIVRRSLSVASSRIYAQTDSPRFGAGPSHPYGMYQQGTVARTASIATTSTTRAGPGRSLSQRTPQHPYAMYPQGVGEDDLDEEEPLHHNPVPVGFPGIGQNYTRRMGPDGEEQDIIGEDGHTEQLPPYSRYPEEGPEKMPLLPTAVHSIAPIPGTDPTMSLMHVPVVPAPTPPPPQSMSDMSARAERRGSGSHVALISDSEYGSTYNEKHKPWRQRNLRDWRRHKVCGVIPMWWIWIILGVIVFISAVLGGVMGGFWAGSSKSNNELAVVTSLWDASLVPSPTSASVPTGTFALQLGEPEEIQSECLSVPGQSAAWDCNLFPNSDLALIVQNQGGQVGARVQYASNDMQLAYGSQTSQMNTSMASFLTVLDKDDPNNGLAFYFQSYFDKVVVVPNNAITQSKRKRDGRREGFLHPDFHLGSKFHGRKQVATPGEQPWFCVWNSTFLEGFIYITDPSSASSSVATTTTASASITGIPTSAPPATATAAGSPSSTAYHTYTQTVSLPSTTITYTATVGPGEMPPWATGNTDGSGSKAQAWSPLGAANGNKVKRQSPNGAFTSVPPPPLPPADSYASLPKFPYVLKLEERRVQLPNAIQPYCQLYQILNNGNANWVGDPQNNGDPIIVQLTETDMSFSAYTSADADGRDTVPGSCHCQWMSGE